MNGVGSTRKRKRPSYLEDFYDNTAKGCNTQDKKVSISDLTLLCTLCGQDTESKENHWNLKEKIEGNDRTLSNVVKDLIAENQVNCNRDFSKGEICSTCRVMLIDLNNLLLKIVEAKASVMKLIQNSEQQDSIKKETHHKSRVMNIENGNQTPKHSTEKSEKVMMVKSKETYASIVKEESNEKPPKNKSSLDKDTIQCSADKKLYDVEALLEKRGYKYLVKWADYSDAYNTWEPRFALPSHIVKYYEKDLTRLGSPIPAISMQVCISSNLS